MKLTNVTFTFEVIESIRHLPGTLEPSDFRRLLAALEVDDIDAYSDDEVSEVAFMALQDLGHEESLSCILSTFYKDQFTPGQIQNLTEELKEDAAWDEYSDLADHRALYVCIDLLNSAFPKEYPEPSLAHLQLTVRAKGLDEALQKHSLDEVALLRGIARAEEEQCRLNRLFSDQLKSGDFPEARWIVWSMNTKPAGENSLTVDCFGSEYWFQGLEEGQVSTTDIHWS